MRMLLEHPRSDAEDPGARIHVRNKLGLTALHLAAEWGRAEACRMLLERGTLVDDTDENGNTPLHLSAQSGDLDIMRVLLEHPRADAEDPGTRIHARNKRGQTALHRAAQSGKADACRLLLERGALVDVIDKNGNTPSHFAAGIRGWPPSPTTIRFLLEYRAKEGLGGLPRAHKLRNRLRRRGEDTDSGHGGEPWLAILEDFASQIEPVEVSLADTWFVDV
ncbi:unnamed protein product [Peniophora sp. CBMAI 1063]|nr:unnamed protein product [Peniophora sp. CBMAI 1063]